MLDSDSSNESSALYIRTLLIFLESILGLCLNAFVAYALIKSSKIVSPSTFLYINLLVSDITFCILSTFLHGYRFFTQKSWPDALCVAEGVIVQVFEGMAVVLVLVQLLNPFLIIVLERPILDNRQLSYILCVVWIVAGFLLSGLPFLGGDTYHEMPSGIWCWLNTESPQWGTVVTLSVTVLTLAFIPIALAVAYTLMWRKMSSRNETLNIKFSRAKQGQWTIIRQGLYLFISFTLSWTYPTIMIAGQFFGKWKVTPDEDFAVAVLGLSANVFNPIILFFSNQKTKASGLRILGKLIGQSHGTVPVPTSDMNDHSVRSATHRMNSQHNRISQISRVVETEENVLDLLSSSTPNGVDGRT